MLTHDRLAEATTRWGASVVAALVVLVAVQQPVWALLLRLGVPVPIVRVARFSKEALLAAVVCLAVAAVVTRRPRQDAVLFLSSRGSRLDRLDLAVGTWVVLVTIHLLLGATLGETLFPRTTDDLWLQLVAYRSLVVGPILLVAVRSLRLGAAGRARVLGAILWASAILSVVAIFEVLAPGVMEQFAQRVLDYRGYQRAVFGIDLPWGIVVQTTFGDGILVTRAGSLLFDYLQLGFFLLPALAIALVRVAGPWSRDSWHHLGLLVLFSVGILATVTRTAILAAGVVVVVIVLTVRDDVVRRRLQRLALAGLVIVVAAAIPTGIAARMVAGLTATDASSNEHVAALELGVQTVAGNPLGIGVGSTAEVGVRSDAAALIVENAYLDIGVQTGLLGMLAFAVFLVALVRALVDRLHADDLAGPALATVLGFAFGAMLLHVWLMIEATWVVYVLAGLALRRSP